MIHSEEEEAEGGKLRGFIDVLFGLESYLKYKDYSKMMCSKECNWIFNPSQIR